MAAINATYNKIKKALVSLFKREVMSILQGEFTSEKSEHFGITKPTHEMIAQAFSRKELHEEYTKRLDSESLREGDIFRLVTQHDFLAHVERAYRMRHRTRTDLFVQGVGSADGASSPIGYLQNTLEKLPLLCDPKDS